MTTRVQNSRLYGLLPCQASVETCVSLGLHPCILSLSIHYPTVIPWSSLVHMCTYFFLQIGLTHNSHIHLSIHVPLASIGAFFTYYTLLSNIAPVLHTCYRASHVYELVLYIFIPIFSLLGLHTQICAPSNDWVLYIYSTYVFIFLVDFSTHLLPLHSRAAI
jgi:hypothetical protein